MVWINLDHKSNKEIRLYSGCGAEPQNERTPTSCLFITRGEQFWIVQVLQLSHRVLPLTSTGVLSGTSLRITMHRF